MFVQREKSDFFAVITEPGIVLVNAEELSGFIQKAHDEHPGLVRSVVPMIENWEFNGKRLEKK